MESEISHLFIAIPLFNQIMMEPVRNVPYPDSPQSLVVYPIQRFRNTARDRATGPRHPKSQGPTASRQAPVRTVDSSRHSPARILRRKLRRDLRGSRAQAIAVVVTVAISLALFGAGLLIRAQAETMKDFWYDRIEISVFLCNDFDTGATCASGAVTDAQKDVILDTLDPVIFDFPTGGLYKPYGIAVDDKNRKVYVTDTDGFIYRYDLDGENQQVILDAAQEPLLGSPYGIIIVEDKIYWGREGGIFMANLDGSGAEPLLESSGAPEWPLGLAWARAVLAAVGDPDIKEKLKGLGYI